MSKTVTPLLPGRVIQSFGRLFKVETTLGVLECVTRGKKTDIACGDLVTLHQTSPKQGVIEQISPRTSLLYRQDEWRSKIIAANVTQILIVTAAVPACNETMLQRCLLGAEIAKVRAIILVNKADMPETQALLDRLQRFTPLGYPLMSVSALEDVSQLNALLAGEVSVMVGQSGMGKSTLVNAILPHARARTGDISTALNAGKHTTTNATLYSLPDGGALIDSPGMQEFGLHHIDARNLASHFPDFIPWLHDCRFHNCWHKQEPGCALSAAAAQGKLDAGRLDFYRELLITRQRQSQH